MTNKKMTAYIVRRINEATVILSFRILLENCIKNGFSATMTKTEIEKEFNKVHDKYGISTFRRDYVLRQCGKDENAIDQHSSNFYIKPDFLNGMTNSDLQNILDEIDEHWGNFQNEQQKILAEIEHFLYDESDCEEKQNFIIEMLTNRETVRRGQAFEVTSYAIMSTFLSTLGFDLNRFSTTYSNDGGIDFAAQNAVYQVTTKLSENKFEEDIKKVSGKPRILLYKELVKDFDLSNFEHELVINHIDSAELCEHLNYLKNKYPQRNLDKVLRTMLDEFRREFYQN